MFAYFFALSLFCSAKIVHNTWLKSFANDSQQTTQQKDIEPIERMQQLQITRTSLTRSIVLFELANVVRFFLPFAFICKCLVLRTLLLMLPKVIVL